MIGRLKTILAVSIVAATAANAQEKVGFVQLQIPHTALAVNIQVAVDPRGSVAIFGGPNYDVPIIFRAPVSRGSVRTTTPRVRFEMRDGAEVMNIEVLGWTDGP
jgi:hypothetical protein